MKYACLCIAVLFLSCQKSSLESGKPEGWAKESHSNDVPPNYPQVLPDAEVKTVTIYLGSDKWAAISKDMLGRTARNFGSSTPVAGITPPPGNGGLDAVPGDPIWVESVISQNEKKWKHVAFRLKGNASLAGSWQSGIYKLPFKLKFDEYEDTYPEINNQRFYGFKELSFSPCYGDYTFMKDKLVAELFREGGVPAAKSAFYKVYIDFGQGVKYCGVYNAIEVIDDTMIKDQFNLSNANVYKPESDLTKFDINLFEKQTNKTAADYTDITGFVSVLNSSLRTSNPAKWKSDLEAVFDVDHFLRYLAINNTIANWDSYGVLRHNYYMVNRQGKMTWIPYDLNLSMQLQGGLNNSRFALSFEMKEVTAAWPLIRFLIDQPDYYEKYKGYVKKFSEEVYIPTKINTKIDQYYTLIKPFVNGVEPEQPKYSHLPNSAKFEESIQSMKAFITTRKTVVTNFVN